MRLSYLCAIGLILSACASVDLYYPDSMFKEGHQGEMSARFVRHWNAIIQTGALRTSLPTKSGHRVQLQGTTILRVSSAECPGYKIQERLGIWAAMQAQYVARGVRFEEVDLGEPKGVGPAAAWVLHQRRLRDLMLVGQKQREFDHSWGIYGYNQKTKAWDLSAHTLRERRAKEHQTVEDGGWLWQLQPCIPALVVVRDGLVKDGGYVCGIPAEGIGEKVPGFQKWAKDLWSQSREERRTIMARPATKEEIEMGEKLAAALGDYMHLEGE